MQESNYIFSSKRLIDEIFFPSHYMYYLLIIIGLSIAIWDYYHPATIGWRSFNASMINGFIYQFIGAAILIRIRSESCGLKNKEILHIIGIFLVSAGFLQFTKQIFSLFQTIVMVNNYPYADNFLSQFDQYIGFDFITYFESIARNDIVRNILRYSYILFSNAMLMTFLLLIFLYKDKFRVRVFLISNILCIFSFSAIGRFFPVIGSTTYYNPDPVLFDFYGGIPGYYHVPTLEYLRETTAPHIDTTAMVGLIAMPSYHTAGAILIFMMLRQTKFAMPAGIFCVLTILATPINGGHYILDLIAGAVGILLIVGLVSRALCRGSHV